MDLRDQEEDAARETPADAGCCPKCQMTARVAVALSTTFLVMGLFLCLIMFVRWTAAPEDDHLVYKTSLKQQTERLQQCQKERHDLTVMLHTATRDSRCSLCPDGWLWWRSHCYFFSVGVQENLRWNESAEFCWKHNSSLAVITDSAEMEFIQSVMRSFPKFPFLWVGLTDTQQEGRWQWSDGTDIQDHMSLTVEWDADHRDCADLRGGGSLFAASCEAYGPWICKKDS
ncbi:CD209 antigen-like protein E isoform X1 [Xyrichtys novacula]|uniref:CD209 antigen-like protein E isoform X1 n=1 Tax=Xyrichtys novacula TaxID=13765 RepID=A0AAV1HLZ0_XYRNO|nr:CD209 antigen-like protein E isoform X1 [Xyrichtys novacula]